MATFLGRYQILSRSSAAWAADDAVLRDGEFGVENTGAVLPVLKIGDNVRPWSMLTNLVGGGGGGGVLDDPTATIGLAAINGVALTGMRSDAAPALSQAIAPTWTGDHAFMGAYTLFGTPTPATIRGAVAGVQTFGTTGPTSGHTQTRGSNDATGVQYIFCKTRSTTYDGLTPVQDGDTIAALHFVGADGTSLGPIAASIVVSVSGAVSSGVVPGQIVFHTGPAGERFRIGTAGGWGIGGANYGTAGQVFTSGGSGAPPTWSNLTLGAANLANPSATLGLAAINGSAVTAMRSDAAPALSQAIVPTWSGQHTWTQPLLVPNGAVGAPSVAFANSPTTGIYRSGADFMAFAAAGTQKMIISAAGVYIAEGSAAFPGLTFLIDGDTGLYRAGANTIGFSAFGAVRMTLSDTLLQPSVPIAMTGATGGAMGAGTINATGLYVNGVAVGAGDLLAQFQFDSVSTSATDPGAGKMKFNNFLYGSVTAIYFNDTSFEGEDVATLLSLLTTGNRIFIRHQSDPTIGAIYEVTGDSVYTTFFTVPVTIVNFMGSTPPNGSILECAFFPTAGTTSFANPTATIGLAVVNGSAVTAMRSDAAPALSQAIVPTWTGAHTFNATVDLAGPVEASGAEGLNGQVLASQGAGLPLVFRNAGSGSIELGYNFAVAVGTADPGNQKLSLNSAVYASVTQIQFDDLAFGNFDATTILSLLTSGNRIYIQARADATRAVVYEVTGPGTDNGGHWSIPVTIIASRGSLFAANTDLTCVFILSSSSIAVANPTGTVGLTAVNGVATTALRSDGAPALSQSIAPVWTGVHNWGGTMQSTARMGARVSGNSFEFGHTNAAGYGSALGANNGNGHPFLAFQSEAGTTANTFRTRGIIGRVLTTDSAGALIFGRVPTASADNQALTTDMTLAVNGGLFMAGASGGTQGSGTINATGLYVNGVAVSAGSGATGANPTASVTLTAVNGAAATFMRSDAAPALSQAIAPTWSGQHTWSLPLIAPNGTAPLPSYAFASDLTSGYYLMSGGNLGVAASGVVRARFTAGAGVLAINATGATGNVYFGFYESGAFSARKGYLGYGNVGDDVFYVAQEKNAAVVIQTNGSTRATFDGAGTTLTLTPQIRAQDGGASAPAYSFTNDPNTGIYGTGSDVIGFAAAGVTNALISSGMLSIGDGIAGTGDRIRLRTSTAIGVSNFHHYFNVSATVLDCYAWDGTSTAVGTMRFRQAQVQVADGLVGAPALTFTSDPDTGIYRFGADTISISAGGAQKFSVNTNGAYFPDGTNLLPSMSFLTDGDTGFFRQAANTIGVALLAVERVRFSTGSIPLRVMGADAVGDCLIGFYESDIDHAKGIRRLWWLDRRQHAPD